MNELDALGWAALGVLAVTSPSMATGISLYGKKRSSLADYPKTLGFKRFQDVLYDQDAEIHSMRHRPDSAGIYTLHLHAGLLHAGPYEKMHSAEPEAVQLSSEVPGNFWKLFDESVAAGAYLTYLLERGAYLSYTSARNLVRKNLLG